MQVNESFVQFVMRKVGQLSVLSSIRYAELGVESFDAAYSHFHKLSLAVVKTETGDTQFEISHQDETMIIPLLMTPEEKANKPDGHIHISMTDESISFVGYRLDRDTYNMRIYGGHNFIVISKKGMVDMEDKLHGFDCIYRMNAFKIHVYESELDKGD